jgi:hypothetical protein
VRHVTGLITPSIVKCSVVFAVILSFGMMMQRSAAQGPAPPQQAAKAAPADTSPATLDHLLAPIALYPDPLLMQVLAASVSEQEVMDGGIGFCKTSRWKERNSMRPPRTQASARPCRHCFTFPMSSI